MTYLGAEGSTANEMSATLRFSADKTAVEKGFAGLVEKFRGESSNKNNHLDVANALWGQNGLDYRSDFVSRCQSSFGGTLQRLDFAADPEAARQKINAWVEARTHDKIKDLLGPDTVRRETDLILTNAIYFKAAWESPFSKLLTTSQDFSSPAGPIKVPLMNKVSQYRYLDAVGDDLQVAELPYEGGDLAMVILLPRARDGLDRLESSLTSEKLEGWIGTLGAPRMVNLSIPRFKLEEKRELSAILKAMGMPLAFSHQADFTGIATGRGLFLSAVVHKAFVDVNEEGTEAAAATGVVMVRTAMRRPEPDPVVFRADHPFLFLIRDIKTGSILFMGRMVKP
jgi:serpin B